jgi:hypothetical protein
LGFEGIELDLTGVVEHSFHVWLEHLSDLNSGGFEVDFCELTLIVLVEFVTGLIGHVHESVDTFHGVDVDSVGLEESSGHWLFWVFHFLEFLHSENDVDDFFESGFLKILITFVHVPLGDIWKVLAAIHVELASSLFTIS